MKERESTVDTQYELTVSKNQLQLLQEALESYFRIRTGQFWDLADELAHLGYVNDKNDPNNDLQFQAYLTRRDDALRYFEHAYRLAKPDPVPQRPPEIMIAIDMWSAIRHFQSQEQPEPKPPCTMDSSPVFCWSGEPEPQIRRCKAASESRNQRT